MKDNSSLQGKRIRRLIDTWIIEWNSTMSNYVCLICFKHKYHFVHFPQCGSRRHLLDPFPDFLTAFRSAFGVLLDINIQPKIPNIPSLEEDSPILANSSSAQQRLHEIEFGSSHEMEPHCFQRLEYKQI